MLHVRKSGNTSWPSNWSVLFPMLACDELQQNLHGSSVGFRMMIPEEKRTLIEWEIHDTTRSFVIRPISSKI